MANEKRRLIDADDFLDLFYVASAGQDKAFVKVVEMVMDDCPAVDAVEVIRCKDCKHLTEDGFCWENINGCVGYKVPASDDFCSYGERKDND